MQLIDTHTHIFGELFAQDLIETIERAKRGGVEKMLLPNIDPSSVSLVESACRTAPGLLPMWGLHPCHVSREWESDLARIYPMFEKVPACAVGEIGLDFYWSREFENEQRRALDIQLGWAVELGLPVSLHTREATRDTLDAVRPFVNQGLRGVFHCFSGTRNEAEEAIGMGFFLGIGGSITYKKNPLRDFISQIPLESLVLETDAPYLPPVPYRGQRNEPAYLQEVVFGLADLYGRPPREIAEITTRNADSLFALKL